MPTTRKSIETLSNGHCCFSPGETGTTNRVSHSHTGRQRRLLPKKLCCDPIASSLAKGCGMKRPVSVCALLVVLFCQQIISQTTQPKQGGQPAGTSTAQQQTKAKCDDRGTYVNSRGQTVRRPENCSAVPASATAQCRDGSYSFSKSGTCSHHGGVAKWL